ncbi:MAG: hypothetical protein E7258_04870 [Lachnospiraceae bacterium]|nr:hypothetical protein [Lachnospiraceae bacterium]
MYKRFVKWLKGYKQIEIKGPWKDRFVNICSKNDINIWGIEEYKGNIRAYISSKDYEISEQYIKKTETKIDVICQVGLPCIINKYKNRYGFILGIIIFFVALYGFTSYIWDINVTGESFYTKEEIIKTVKDNYVDIGTPVSEINCEELEKALRNEYDKVAWISCEITGTRLNIEINETIEKDTIEAPDTPCNIIAVKDGIITKIVTRHGKTVKTIGEEVKKGDVIITGVINLYNDYDELIETNHIPADGDVYAIVESEYYDEFDMNYYEKVYTENESKGISFLFGNKVITPFEGNNDYELYDKIVDEHKLKLGNYIYLPISFYEITTKEYTSVLKTYTEEQAKEKAYKRMALYVEKLRKKGVSIVENNVTIDYVNDKCIMRGTIVTEELIGVPSELIIIEQGEP